MVISFGDSGGVSPVDEEFRCRSQDGPLASISYSQFFSPLLIPTFLALPLRRSPGEPFLSNPISSTSFPLPLSSLLPRFDLFISFLSDEPRRRTIRGRGRGGGFGDSRATALFRRLRGDAHARGTKEKKKSRKKQRERKEEELSSLFRLTIIRNLFRRRLETVVL